MTHCSVLCSNWWCRKHVREYLPVVWMTEPNFVGYLKSANIYIVRFLFVNLKRLNLIFVCFGDQTSLRLRHSQTHSHYKGA